MALNELLGVAEEIASRALRSGDLLPDHEIAQALSIAFSIKEEAADKELVERAEAVIAALA